MTTVQPIIQNSTVQLNTAGNGTCPPIGPMSPGETWTVTLISVQCSSNANESTASVYLNGALVGTTLTGSTGDTDSAITLAVQNGQTFSCTWIGGDHGATATMTVIGSRVVG